MNVPLHRPYIDNEELEAVKEVLESGWLTKGPKGKELEDKCAEYLGAKYATTTTSCTTALHLALLAIGVGPGDEVLVADYTFPATGHAVMYCGAIPRFIDIDHLTYNMNPQLIEHNITSKTKAIIPIHAFGHPASMEAIMFLANKHGLYVIEDAACAFGSEYKGKKVGTIADVGCFSFHVTKGITTGEGGLVTTNNKEIADIVKNLSVFGRGKVSSWDAEKSDTFISPRFEHLGYNYKMSDILAAIGIVQLGKLERIIKRKTELAEYWNEKLNNIPLITAPFVSDFVRHNYQGYTTLVDDTVDRDSVIEKMKQKGIQLQIGTYSSFREPIYSEYVNYKCPVSEDIYWRALRLPMYYELTEEQIDYAAPILEETLKDSVNKGYGKE